MTVTPSTGTDAPEVATLLRLVVVGPERRAELVVPARVAVVDLVPDLARAVGLLDALLVHAGYRLVRPDGTVLDGARTLADQSVDDGSVLAVEAAAHDEDVRTYDDVVEAVADAVEAATEPWTPTASRRSALAAAAVLLVVAVVALGLEFRSGAPVAAAGAILSVLLLGGAAVLSRSYADHETAVVTAALAVPPAAVAGLAAVPDEPLRSWPLGLAGLAALAATALGAALVRRFRPMLLPAAALAVLAAVVGVAGLIADPEPAAVVATVVALAVLVGSLVPALAVARTRIRTPDPAAAGPDAAASPGDSDTSTDDGTPDARSVRHAVGSGRLVLVGLVAATGVLVVAAAPFLVRLGVSGLLLGVVLAALVLLRTRRTRARSDVGIGLTAGVVALAVLAVAAALEHPGGRPALAAGLVAVGIVLLLVARAPVPDRDRNRLWLGRAADVAEGGAMVALLPLLVLATGLVSAVRT